MFAICLECGPATVARIDEVINVGLVGTALVYEIVGASGMLFLRSSNNNTTI